MKKKLFISSFLLFLTSVVYAQRPFNEKAINYKIAPLFGYETTYRTSPTPHTSTHVMYGARVTIGAEKLSGEIEVTRGTDSENYLTAPQKINYTDDKLKLGINSSYRLGQLFNVAARLGGQAKRTTKETVTNGQVTVTEDPIEYSPYAGAAFGVYLGMVSLHVGTTVVFKDVNDMEKNEYQNSISVSAGL